MPCHKCSNQNYFSGSFHIGCKNPPAIVAKFSNASGEMKEKAREGIAKVQEENPEIELVCRCIWSKSGTFPMYYDPNTVLACTNLNKKPDKPRESNPLLEMFAILKNERYNK